MTPTTRLEIKSCPTCESRRIRRVQRDYHGAFQGKRYVVPALEFWECPVCGELVLDRDAMRRIEAASPAYRARRGTRKPNSLT